MFGIGVFLFTHYGGLVLYLAVFSFSAADYHTPKQYQTNQCLRKYLWWNKCTLYLLACQVRVTVGDSGLCHCVLCEIFRALINSCVLILRKG